MDRSARDAAKTTRMVLVIFMMLVCLRAAAHAGPGTEAYPFTEGTARLSLFFGGSTAFDQDYTVFGLGGGYFIADGLEVGLDAETWFGNSPRIEQVSPQARVVINTSGPLKPYAGAFYQRTHIEGYRDKDTVGARAGLYFLTGMNAYFGVGLVQDVHLNCDRTAYSSCAETYPEFLFAVIFR